MIVKQSIDLKTFFALGVVLGILSLIIVITSKATGTSYYGLYSLPLDVQYYNADNTPYSHGAGEANGYAALDISVPSGTPVYAVVSGSVSSNCSDGAYGTHACLKGDDGLLYLYAHLENVSRTGTVYAGQRIGESGCSGRCFGPHLHFEIRCSDPTKVPNGCTAGQKFPHNKTCTGVATGPYKFIEGVRDHKLNYYLPDPGFDRGRHPIRRAFGSNPAPWARYGGCLGDEAVADPYAEDRTAPDPGPRNMSAEKTRTSITLRWAAASDPSGIAGYIIKREGLYIQTTTNTYYTDSGLDCSTRHNYSVIAYDKYGNVRPATAAVSTSACAHGGPQSIPIPLPEPDIFL